MKHGTVLWADTHAPVREGVRSNLLVTGRIIAQMDQERRFTISVKSALNDRIEETGCPLLLDNSENTLVKFSKQKS